MSSSNINQLSDLLIQPLTKADFEGIYEILSNPSHTEFLSFPTPKSKKESDILLQSLFQNPANKLWSIKLRHAALIGIGGILCDTSTPNFIVSIDNGQHSKGYGQEASNAILNWAKFNYGIERVELNIHSKNLSSLKLAEKLGCTKTSSYLARYPQRSCEEEILVFSKIL